MAQIAPEWEELPEFVTLGKKLQEKYSGTPYSLDHVDLNLVVAYVCINKTKPKGKSKLYEISGLTEPESFLHPKRYIVKMYHDVWEGMDDKNRLALVFSALHRIDKEDPESGKVLGLDMHDQGFMVRTLGPDWQVREDIPDLLNDEVEFRGAAEEEVTI